VRQFLHVWKGAVTVTETVLKLLGAHNFRGHQLLGMIALFCDKLLVFGKHWHLSRCVHESVRFSNDFKRGSQRGQFVNFFAGPHCVQNNTFGVICQVQHGDKNVSSTSMLQHACRKPHQKSVQKMFLTALSVLKDTEFIFDRKHKSCFGTQCFRCIFQGGATSEARKQANWPCHTRCAPSCTPPSKSKP